MHDQRFGTSMDDLIELESVLATLKRKLPASMMLCLSLAALSQSPCPALPSVPHSLELDPLRVSHLQAISWIASRL